MRWRSGSGYRLLAVLTFEDPLWSECPGTPVECGPNNIRDDPSGFHRVCRRACRLAELSLRSRCNGVRNRRPGNPSLAGENQLPFFRWERGAWKRHLSEILTPHGAALSLPRAFIRASQMEKGVEGVGKLYTFPRGKPRKNGRNARGPTGQSVR